MKISSEQEMIDLGKELAQEHSILLLQWELWAGKTALSKGFATGLGIKENKVQSPTYAYLNIYDDKLLHIDMYRIETFEDIVEKGILNLIQEHNHIVIERPKYIDQLWFSDYTLVTINKTTENERNVVIEKNPKIK